MIRRDFMLDPKDLGPNLKETIRWVLCVSYVGMDGIHNGDDDDDAFVGFSSRHHASSSIITTRRRITQQYEGTLETDLGFVIAVRVGGSIASFGPSIHFGQPTHLLAD